MCEPVKPAEVAALLREWRRIRDTGVSEAERASYLAWKVSVFARLDALASKQAEHEANTGRGL